MRESFTYKTIGEADFNSLLREGSGKPFLVVFTAEWLGEGTIMDAIIEGLAADYEGQVGFYRMDVEESKNISHQMGIRRLPAIYLFKHGEIADHFSGMVPARTIQQHIEQLLS